MVIELRYGIKAAYVLDAQSGTLALTGQAATLEHGGSSGGEHIISDSTLSGADQGVYQELYLDGTSDTEVVTDLVNDQLFIDTSGFSVGTHYLNIWFRESVSGDESEKVPYTYVKS